jgi:chromosome segregation ATPase
MLNTEVNFSLEDTPDDGRALSMVNYDPSLGQFVINPEALEVIRQLQSPLGVISVAGMYRTGKSYLLNRMLLNRSGGFSVGPSINPCTKGLWMWSKTIPAHTPQGKPLNVLIIDTEGIGATDEDHNHDNKIMTLAILLSSYFLFNSMGTIDESSIQSLSFIVNITKNIQQKNGNKDFAKYLPAFMWVIRDFSLQLKNRDGNPITSKEYLEYSLELQNGTSEFIVNKNQIRKLVKEYFPNRDCVTLVRPLLEEGNLQKLERTPASKLRKEFIEQVNYLRKTVLNSINPKKLNGQELNGEMFIDLIKSYVKMINEGAVPIIQTAWTYMRQNQALLAKKNALENYKKKTDEIINKFPMKEEFLRNILKKIKKEIILNFNEEIIGEADEKDLKELKSELKKIKSEIINKNINSTKTQTNRFLIENYKNIDEKIKNNEYLNISEYKDDIEQFVQFCLNKCPPGPNRDIIIYEFIIKNIINTSGILSKSNMDEMERIICDNSNNVDELIKELKEEKDKEKKLNNELKEITEKLEKLNQEKDKITSQNSNESDNLNKLMEEKNNEIIKLKNKLNTTEKICEQKIKEMRQKVEEAEKISHQKELESTQISSDFQREKVLMEQKIIFLEKTLKELEDNKLRSNPYNTTSKKNRNDETTLKQKKEKLEDEIKRLNKVIKELQEKNIELDSQLLTKGKRIENEKNNIAELVETYQKKLEDLQDSNSELAKNINKFKEDAAKQMEILSTEYEKQIEEILSQQKNLDEEFKTKEEELRKNLAKVQAELSVLMQDKDLVDKKIEQIKDKNQSEKIEHDKYIKILEENNKELLDKYEMTSKENSDLKNIYTNELNQLTSENNSKEEQIRIKNEKLKDELNQLISEYDSQIKNLKSKVIENENNIIPKMKQKILDLQNEKENLSQDIELCGKSQKHKLAEIALQYEDQKEQIINNNRQQLEDNNNENDQQIQEIRKVYQIEKDKISEQMRNENDTAQERINQIEKEQNEILNELEKEKDDKIAELQDTLDEINLNHDEYVKKIEKELFLRNQKIENLQKFINDTKNSIDVIKMQQEQYLKEQSEEFENEKNILNEKIKNAEKDCETTEIEINKLKEQNTQMESNLSELKEKYTDLEQEYKDVQNNLDQEINELKNKLNDINNNINMNNANYEKELSLKEQKSEFLSKKLDEIKKELNDLKESFEEKLNQTKEDVTTEYTEKIENMKKEKENLENIINNLEKEYSTLQQKYETETETLTKEKESVTEKLNDLTIKKKQLGDQLDGQHCTDQTIILKLRNEFKLKNDGLVKDNLSLQEKLQKLEQSYNKLTNSYDTEKANWENKFSFIAEQKDSLNKELEELKIKYNENMDELQKKILEERERLELIYKKSLADGENIHNQQLQQAQETFNKKYEEVNVQNNNLIAENATLVKKIDFYQNNNTISEIDTKLQDALDKEKKYKEQYEKLKKEKEEAINKLKLKLNNETEIHKKKIEELELKLQEYEGKRNNKNADLVKLKAVSDKDNENKVLLIQQLNETLERLKKENEKLTSENKEVQRENENYRKSSRGSSRNSSNIGMNNYIPNRRRNGNSYYFNKENINGNFNPSSSQNDEIKINLIPKNFNHTVTKSAMSPLNNSSVTNNNE